MGSRADELRARLEAELAVVELEDELAEAKQSGGADNELKERVRAARQAYREAHRVSVPAGEGDAVAAPEPIRTKVKVQEG